MSDPLIVAVVMVPAAVVATLGSAPSDVVQVAWITMPTALITVVLTWWNQRITAKAQAATATAAAKQLTGVENVVTTVSHTVNSQLSTALDDSAAKSRIIEGKDQIIAGLEETIAMAAKMQKITETAPAVVKIPPRPKRARKAPKRP